MRRKILGSIEWEREILGNTFQNQEFFQNLSLQILMDLMLVYPVMVIEFDVGRGFALVMMGYCEWVFVVGVG